MYCSSTFRVQVFVICILAEWEGWRDSCAIRILNTNKEFLLVSSVKANVPKKDSSSAFQNDNSLISFSLFSLITNSTNSHSLFFLNYRIYCI